MKIITAEHMTSATDARPSKKAARPVFCAVKGKLTARIPAVEKISGIRKATAAGAAKLA